MGNAACTPVCLKAIGLELPHCTGSKPWLRLHIHAAEAPYLLAEPRRAALHDPLPKLLPTERRMLGWYKRSRGQHTPLRFHFSHGQRWPFHFYLVKLPDKGLLLPCASLQHLQLVLWVELYDPLAYAPIFHLLCSDPAPHPLTRQLLWKTHRRFTLAQLWPNCTQVMEETDCGCGVRVTVRFGALLDTSAELGEPDCGEWVEGSSLA